jgi:hypothetical protein
LKWHSPELCYLHLFLFCINICTPSLILRTWTNDNLNWA